MSIRLHTISSSVINGLSLYHPRSLYRVLIILSYFIPAQEGELQNSDLPKTSLWALWWARFRSQGTPVLLVEPSCRAGRCTHGLTSLQNASGRPKTITSHYWPEPQRTVFCLLKPFWGPGRQHVPPPLGFRTQSRCNWSTALLTFREGGCKWGKDDLESHSIAACQRVLPRDLCPPSTTQMVKTHWGFGVHACNRRRGSV